MSKLVVVLAWCVTITFTSLAASEDEPAQEQAVDLAAPAKLMAGRQPIEVGGYAAPFYGDIDEDGRKDLLVGQYTLGRLRIYRNVGSRARPRFDSFEWFTAGGEIAGVPHCCQVAFTPQLVDFDGDGGTDILTGSGVAGEVFLYRRRADGSFAAAEVLQNMDGQVLMHRGLLRGRDSPRRYNVTALAYDWEGDGDVDLLLGMYPLNLVLNEGTVRDPWFDQGRLLECDGEPIRGGFGAPQMADWDGDGRDDLIAGTPRDIVWYRNMGARGKPQFESPRLLIPQHTRSPIANVPSNEPGFLHAFCVTDFNSDGRLDLLVGDRFRRVIGISEGQFQLTDADQKRLDELQERYSDIKRNEADGESATEQVERYRELLGIWQECEILRMNRNFSRGSRNVNRSFVWLYERVDPRRME